MFFVVAVLVSVLLAAAVLLTVAVSGGHLQLPENSRFTGYAQKGAEILGADGTPPRFLDRLDEVRPASRG
ncbi:MAG TPA: hypothetical protein K8V15_06635 [Tessaracoccus flavescens]|uniref:Uncharacterized protein n=1 Tax=Tessaracoccus flavescens TaxID=399497 RepID=A0A921JRL5_9ACTN|nr:hypothetical protein [Tessaracoccus flavescens]